MKKISIHDAVKIDNAATCKVIEYPFNVPDINGSVITVNGRYPETGFAVNLVCKEVVYVISGSGTLGLNDGKATKFNTGDSIFLDANEKYFWQGDFECYMACSPAFYPEQHKMTIE